MTPRRTALTAAALVTPALLAAMLVAPTAATADDVSTSEKFELVGRFQNGGAEVSAVRGDRMYVINGTSLDIVDISELSLDLDATTTVPLGDYGDSITSVAVGRSQVAVTMPAATETDPGTLVLLNTAGKVLRSVKVGSLPDMVTFDDAGKNLLVANEGQPEGYAVGDTDPEGSVSLVDVAKVLGGKSDAVRTVRFNDFNTGGTRAADLPAGVRISGPNASVAQDLEPEYITVEGNRAFVTLQENNAIAEIDIAAGTVVAIRALALKNHSQPDSGFDGSNDDGAINIKTWPVWGMPMPDAIASFVEGGSTYLITANEGDAREYGDKGAPGFYIDEAKIKDLVLDPTAFPDADLQKKKNLGNLRVIVEPSALADGDGDGDIDKLVSYGTRSFTIWNADGSLKWDSGDQIEQKIKELLPAYFNSDNEADEDDEGNVLVNTFDGRSDNKGPEPEGVTIGVINGKRMAFIGLERVGGFMVYDISNPATPTFLDYVNNRDFGLDPADESNDSGPEVLSFVAAEDSPSGRDLVVVSNEISGSVTIWSPKQ
jgi:LVIVD repeat